MPTTSPDLAISTHELRKTYQTRQGKHMAVDGLDLAVPRGGVHGFLGPNGSGKTTTIRMLLGLIRADGGTMQILGQPVPEKLPEVIGSLGAIVEQPKFFGNFSGRLSLELAADAIGVPRSDVQRVLVEVGLDQRADDKFRTYSLGMKQRLAVAAALLKKPEILIFDEPTNGLDPAGIHEVREMMRGLGRQGRTVLVSSHILSEVEHIADTVSIIARGRLIAQGRVADVIGRGSAAPIRVGLPDLPRARQVLTEAGFTVRTDGQVLLVDAVSDAASITRTLAAQDLWVEHLSQAGRDLETVFLQLTAGEQLNAPPPTPRRSAPFTSSPGGSVDDGPLDGPAERAIGEVGR